MQKQNSSNKLIIKLTAILLVVVGVVIIGSRFDISIKPKGSDQQVTESSSDDLDAVTLAGKVIPNDGYTVDLNWGDTGIKLVEAGGIDLDKYRENYSDEQWSELLTYLTESKDGGITITPANAYFWVNTLWALGLTQQSDVLSNGIMGTEYKDRVGNFASTGGWTLGSRDAVSLYSSSSIIPLTQGQQDLVAKVSEHIYRPCCGNPTSFPDCNHGMAILGLLELMASQGFDEKQMYEASLAFNSYWFTTTYVDLAYYFQKEKGLGWDEVDPEVVLSAEYSSAPGYQNIKKQIGTIPGSQTVGASCGT